MNTTPSIEENTTILAFDKQAAHFDQLYKNNTIIHYKRKRVRELVEKYLSASSYILELNAGTGDDAVYFAKKGHRVHATDISTGMLNILKEKTLKNKVSDTVSTELCSFTQLNNLIGRGPYDLVFSNFAGLNCTGELEKVLAQLSSLVRPGGFIALTVLPKFCLWEFLLLFKGKFKTAFRRFSGRKGSKAHIEGEWFRCWYYNPSFIRKHLGKSFQQVALEGLCTLVPPSYIEHFAEKHPRLYRSLVKKEDSWKRKWPWRSIGDYYTIILQKK